MAEIHSPRKRKAEEQADGHANKRPKRASFAEVTIDDLLHERGSKRRHVVTFFHNDTIRHAVKTLAAHNILSAPVFSNVALDDEEDQYLGTVSVLEILKGVINDVLGKADEKEANHKVEKSERFKDLVDSGHKFLDRLLITVVGGDVSMLPKLYADTPALTAIRDGFMAGDGSRGTHRVALFDTGSGRITDIISQSDVVRFVAAHPHLLAEKADQTVDELGLVQGSVISVGANQPAAEAFQIMFENKVSAVAVVDFDGNLVCNLSASDLRGLGERDFPLLDGDVESFISSKKEHARSGPEAIVPPVTVHPSTRLRDLLTSFAATRVHRAYVVGEGHHKPVGVISLTDIMRVLAAL